MPFNLKSAPGNGGIIDCNVTYKRDVDNCERNLLGPTRKSVELNSSMSSGRISSERVLPESERFLAASSARTCSSTKFGTIVLSILSKNV